MTPSAGTAAQPSIHPRRRRQPRFPLHSLAYVRLEDSNGGIIRDLTESGIALQVVSPLQPGEEVGLHFDLFSPRVRIESRARVAWADQSGQAGVSFTDLSPRVRRALRDWMLIQIFTAAAASGRDSIFAPLDRQLVLSPAAMPAIALPPLAQPRLGEIQWGLFDVSTRTFAILLDTVVLICAILLFSVTSIAVMGGLPPLPIAATLLMASAAIFVAVYHLVFSDFLCGPTPGKRLAEVAASADRDDIAVARFR
jgi:PilZ domain-containing protein